MRPCAARIRTAEIKTPTSQARRSQALQLKAGGACFGAMVMGVGDGRDMVGRADFGDKTEGERAKGVEALGGAGV
jgi:hypothetical protein